MMMETTEQMQYSSLSDIRQRKDLLRKGIEADDEKIKNLWGAIFRKPDALSSTASTGKRLNSLLSIGAGAFDGALLAWKLYRKFKR